MPFQPGCDQAPRLIVLPHSHGKGLDSAQRQPTIERSGYGARRVLDELEPFGQIVSGGERDTADHVTVAVYVLGSGMDYNLGPELNRPLEEGCGEGIVDDEYHIVMTGEIANGRKIGNVHHRVRRSLDEDHPGLGGDCALDESLIPRVYKRKLQPQLLENMSHDAVGSTVHVFSTDDVVSGLQQLENGIRGGEAGSECMTVGRSLQGGEIPFESVSGWIPGSSVFESFVLSQPRLYVCGGLEDGGHDGARCLIWSLTSMYCPGRESVVQVFVKNACHGNVCAIRWQKSVRERTHSRLPRQASRLKSAAAQGTFASNG
jgi:hypothetical protein